jgi:hypothetical protein
MDWSMQLSFRESLGIMALGSGPKNLGHHPALDGGPRILPLVLY